MAEENTGKKLIVGFDLDGVIASPLFDGVLINIRILKEHLLKSLGRKKDYFYPKTRVERWAWVLLNRLRQPNVDLTGLKELKKTAVSLCLITSRFRFLEPDTRQWLSKYGLDKIFDSIYINNSDLNPIDFKASVLNENLINYYVDDDLEVLLALNKRVRSRLYLLGDKKQLPEKTLEKVSSVDEFVSLITRDIGGRNTIPEF